MFNRARIARTLLSLATSSAAGSSPATTTSAPASAASKKPLANPFALRQSPYSLHQPGLTSSLLSEHPLTQKAERDELAFRQRMLSDRGEFDDAAKVAEELVNSPEGSRYNEYRYVVFFAVLGYLSAHVVVYNWMHRASDVRLPYDPVRGFVDDLMEHKKACEAFDSDFRRGVTSSLTAKSGVKPHPSLLSA